MEDGVKEEPAQSKETKFLGKAGWVKKAPGKLLASYKDRYIHVGRTEVVVYEHEDLQTCLEKLDLENYDRCHELRSPFKKKHRLVLIRSAKSGNKIQDVKFQAQTAEEKEAWIKALSDGIHRAKNKVFDEVKIDESSNLEHVTRSRPKGNPNRRPPTRIHMKEVADLSCDGNQRLDLDGAVISNGPSDNTDGTERPKSTEKQSGPSPEEGPQTEPEVSPQKKVIKPPMPPTKEVKPSPAPEVETDGADKKVLKPPMPPSKEGKPCVSPGEEVPDETNPEKSPEGQKKTGPPPTPPNKPSSSSNQAETSQPVPTNSQPPTPPSKESKPSPPAVEPDQEGQSPANEKKEKEEDSREETTETAADKDEVELLVSEEAAPTVRANENPSTEDQTPEESGNTMSTCSPPVLSKKKPETQQTESKPDVSQPNEKQECTASDTSDSSLQEEDVLPKSEVPPVAVSVNVPLTDGISLSPLLCLPGEKKKKTEEKSVDSGQHSDDDSEGSGSEDMLAASTAALRGSNAGLDALESSEDNIQISVSLTPSQATNKPQVISKPIPSTHTKPVAPRKPPIKVKSASIGDLLSESSLGAKTEARGQSWGPTDDVKKLETEVALEREKTGALLRRVSKSQSQDEGDGKNTPEELLAEALEKLEKADLVLREVKKLKVAENPRDRKSW